MEMVRDHRAIESCLDGTDAGVFDYDPYPRIPDPAADAWGASQGCNVFYDIPDSDDEEADDRSGGTSDHEPDHPTPALLCNFLAVLVPAALGEGSVIADGRVVDALAAKVPPFGPRSAWARGREGRDAPGVDGRRVGLFDVMEAPDSTHGTLGTLGTLGTRVGVAAARDALIACAFARATFGADVGTDADEFSRALAGPLCGYLVARRGGWCPSGLCASLAVWRACVQSLEGASASREFNPGLRRLASFVAETEAEIGANFVDALAGLHKLNAAGWRVAEETLVTYAMESASGSGRTLLSWLADTMPRYPSGIDACRSLFFSALDGRTSRGRCPRMTKSPPMPRLRREHSPRGSPTTSGRARSSGRVSSTRMGGLRTRWSGRCGSRSVGGRRRPERWRFAASRGTRAFDSPVGVRRLQLRVGSVPMSSDATSPRTSRFCTRTPPSLPAASTPPGATGSRSTPGLWRGTSTI